MLSKAELIDAIEQLENGKHTIQNCEKLAAIYIVLDHLYGEEQPKMESGYSYDSGIIESDVGSYGNSEFLQMIAGKPAKAAWLLMDELVEALTVLNPRLISNFFDKLNDL